MVLTIFSLTIKGDNCCTQPTYITQADMPYTIQQAGTYCLREPVRGNVVINNLSNVVLDLSGKSISAGNPNIYINGCSNVTVCNGTVEYPSNVGINIYKSNNVVLKNLDFLSGGTGTLVKASRNVHINNCTFRGCWIHAIHMELCTGGSITDSLCERNNTPVVMVLSKDNNIICRNLKIVETNAADPSCRGILVTYSNNCDFISCSVNNSTIIADTMYAAYFFDSSLNIKVCNCDANSNYNSSYNGNSYMVGFSSTSNQVLFDSCVANYNEGHFVAGIWLVGNNNYTITSCTICANNATNTCAGIALWESSGIVRNNNIFNNRGTINSTGISNNQGATRNAIWSNKVQGHANNFVGAMPKVTYDLNTGNFFIYGTTTPTTPTPYDNISIQ
jgi:hypothetical protein